MPRRHRAQRAVQRLFQRSPFARARAFKVLDLWFQTALLPFRRIRKRGSIAEDANLVSNTERFNRAAEEYFARLPDPSFLLNKPFSDPDQLHKHLIDAGVLMASARVLPGDVVLELGAGSCWLSYILNRYGCQTISVDVSPSAIELGRSLFEREGRTNWNLDPQFMSYDGHRLPLADASCDRAVINDAFHHVPNQRELLSEISRVLRADGILAMSEPGQGHGSASHSLEEARAFGVLENELVLEDVAALARDCGFEKVSIVLASPSVLHEINADDLGAFMGGKGFTQYWTAFCTGMEQHHYILCHKTASQASTRRPDVLAARIEIVRPLGAAEARVDVPLQVTLRVTNTGNTVWLGGDRPVRGWTRVGAHLLQGGSRRDPIDVDWWRGFVPNDVPPGAQFDLQVILPPLGGAGQYEIVFDLVVEGLTWFAGRGSPTVTLPIVIRELAPS